MKKLVLSVLALGMSFLSAHSNANNCYSVEFLYALVSPGGKFHCDPKMKVIVAPWTQQTWPSKKWNHLPDSEGITNSHGNKTVSALVYGYPARHTCRLDFWADGAGKVGASPNFFCI